MTVKELIDALGKRKANDHITIVDVAEMMQAGIDDLETACLREYFRIQSQEDKTAADAKNKAAYYSQFAKDAANILDSEKEDF